MIYIVSPHIDDAVLSLGGLISEIGKRRSDINVKYIFTFSSWTNPLASIKLPSNNAEEITGIRAKEEEKVSLKLNYTFELLGYLDFPLRDGRSTSELNIEIRKCLKARIKKEDICLFPIGIFHPDHIIVADLGFLFLDKGYKVLFYEDLPYAAYYGIERVNSFGRKRLEAVNFEIDIASKIEVIKLYETQVSSDWLDAIVNYSYDSKIAAFRERLWKPVEIDRKTYGFFDRDPDLLT